MSDKNPQEEKKDGMELKQEPLNTIMAKVEVKQEPSKPSMLLPSIGAIKESIPLDEKKDLADQDSLMQKSQEDIDKKAKEKAIINKRRKEKAINMWKSTKTFGSEVKDNISAFLAPFKNGLIKLWNSTFLMLFFVCLFSFGLAILDIIGKNLDIITKNLFGWYLFAHTYTFVVGFRCIYLIITRQSGSLANAISRSLTQNE